MANVNSLQITKGLKVSPGQIMLFPTRAAAGADKAIGITEANSMTLGYGFLSQYKTVWDYVDKKIYLLKQ